ncbi:MAG: SgcJ/EcaC family oxidoreductase [Nitrospira sp.]|nr:SgcJ/EcaC family oxidoreductase [Nitrospira sp.]
MRSVLISLAFLSLFSSGALAGDDAAIKDRLDQFQAAWNKDDTQAMAAIWAEDGSLINPVGVTAHGRAEVEKIFINEHTNRFKGTTYKTRDVTVQWVTPDVAVADVTANITGIRGPDGAAAPDYDHHVVWVLVRKDGQWMAAAARPYQFPAKPAEAK